MHTQTPDDHDDFGGLDRDLRATRAAIDRRGLFRLAARLGAGIGALQLLGCASNPASPSVSSGESGGGGSCGARIPEEGVANRVATSQIALPKAACDAAYATAGYQSSVANLSRVSLATDNVFSDGSALELATVTGSVAEGFTSALTVAI
jgi:hypothetical protein